jgi:hypothetical protein
MIDCLARISEGETLACPSLEALATWNNLKAGIYGKFWLRWARAVNFGVRESNGLEFTHVH